ncbi:MAG: hypothetical protein R3244_08205, partial [Thermoanaerobaculia bacterium]|nr:hypothetical protein [Thermoanaerobaculia bacterium]
MKIARWTRSLIGPIAAVLLFAVSATSTWADAEIAKLLASDGGPGDNLAWRVGLAIDGDTLLVGGSGFSGNPGRAYIFQRDVGGPDNWGEVVKLVPLGPSQYLGNYVAIDGDTAVVGARETFGPFTHTGRAYIFERDQGGADNWGQIKELVSPTPATGGFFGQSVAVSGNWAFVGQDGPLPNYGRVFVFERDNGGPDNWGHVTTISNPDPAGNDQFDLSLSAHGDTLVVGAPGDDNANGLNAGAAYVFQKDQGGVNNWGLVKKLLASDGQPGDRLTFIGAAAVDGDTIVLGACGDLTNVGGSTAGLAGCHSVTGQPGKAYVFERDAGGADNWGEVAILTASDAAAGDQFGIHGVAIDGDRVVVGAPSDDPGGSLYVFDRNAGGPAMWGEIAKFVPSDVATGDNHGNTVAIDGLTIAGGSPFDDDLG